MILSFWLLLFLVFYTFIGYGILLFILVKIKELFCKRNKVIVPFNQLPEVSLVIAAYNEEDVVDLKMRNCLKLSYPKNKLNIVWITDGSCDSTNELLKKYDVKVFFQPQREGKTAALNRIMSFISTPITIFTDANTMLVENSILEMVNCFAYKDVGCVAGEKQVISEKNDGAVSGEGIYWKYESFLKSLDSRLYSCVGAAGELFGIRSNLYERLPKDTLLDDFQISLKITSKGYKTMYCKDAIALENPSDNMIEEGKRKVRIAGGGIQAIIRLWPLMNVFKYGVFSFQYISHRVLRWSVAPFALLFLYIVNFLIVINKLPYFKLYLIFLILQSLFYFVAFVGFILEKFGAKTRIFYVPYYFCTMNLNVINGIFYLNKKQTGVWERAKRK